MGVVSGDSASVFDLKSDYLVIGSGLVSTDFS